MENTLLKETMDNLVALVREAKTREEAIELKAHILRPVGVLCSRFNIGKSNLSKRSRNIHRRKSRSAKE